MGACVTEGDGMSARERGARRVAEGTRAGRLNKDSLIWDTLFGYFYTLDLPSQNSPHLRCETKVRTHLPAQWKNDSP